VKILCLKNILQNREKENHHVQTKSFYFNRAFSGDCHHCLIDGHLDARAAARQETGQCRRLQIQPASMECDLAHVYTG
jgi:hypothetical protein